MNTNAHISKCIFQKYGKYKDFVTRQFVYRKGEVRIALYIISFYEIRNPVKLLLVQKSFTSIENTGYSSKKC